MEKASPYSNLKIFVHLEEVNKVKCGERIAPIYVRIKPTNRCNQNCNYCHYKNPYLELDQYHPADEIDREKMLEMIHDFKDIGVKAVTFSGGGEPLLYPYIEEAMEAVLDAGIDLSVITNGSLLTSRKAELLTRA
ncbi:MAG: radical SAM protein, partial [Lachnospiraceae bacterium]|nr:radical SAM protein [Lachnospiraceae bacterium]